MVDKRTVVNYTQRGLVVSSSPHTVSPAVGATASIQQDVSNVMSGGRLSHGSLNILDFAEQSVDGVFIDVSGFDTILDLQLSLDKLFQTGHYLVDFDYKKISQLLFGERRFDNGRMRIASAIMRIDTKRQSLYRKLIISRDKKSVQYFFESVYLSVLSADGIQTEQAASLSIDEFIAHLWSGGIRHGIDIEVIQSAIQDQKKGLIVVAKETAPSDTLHPKLEPVISFTINQSPRNGASNQRTDLLTYEQGYVRVDEDKPIYKKVPGKVGIPGWTIFGEKIEPESIRDFDIGTFKGDGVCVKVIDGIEYLYSEYNGFPRIEEGTVEQGRQKVQQMVRIHVDRDKVFDTIGMSTGRVEVAEGIVSENDVRLDIVHALTVHAKRNIEANIRAKNQITVDGSIFGTACSSIITRKRQYVGVSPKGTIVSEDGDIIVGGSINDALLEARQGNIHLTRSENSLVIGKVVTIEDTAYNTIIVAESVIIKGKAIGCKIIANNVVIQESAEKGHHENIVSVFLHDYSDRMHELETLRQRLIEQVQSIEARIDRDIVLRFKSLEKFDAGKRLSMTRILVEIMDDASKKEDPKYNGYVQIYNSLESLLRTYGTDWQKIKQLNQALDVLTQEIKKMSQIMEGEKLNSSVQIGHISTRTLLRTLSYKGTLGLLDLTPEQIIELSDCQIGGEIGQLCKTAEISDNSSGSITYGIH